MKVLKTDDPVLGRFPFRSNARCPSNPGVCIRPAVRLSQAREAAGKSMPNIAKGHAARAVEQEARSNQNADPSTACSEPIKPRGTRPSEWGRPWNAAHSNGVSLVVVGPLKVSFKAVNKVAGLPVVANLAAYLVARTTGASVVTRTGPGSKTKTKERGRTGIRRHSHRMVASPDPAAINTNVKPGPIVNRIDCHQDQREDIRRVLSSCLQTSTLSRRPPPSQSALSSRCARLQSE